MLSKKQVLVGFVILATVLEIDGSTIRESLMENINNGLKMFGKNDRRLYVSHQSYYNNLLSGISNKIADLVSQSFSPRKPVRNKYSIRQDAIVIGDEGTTLSENPFMSGMLKMLGFDGAKIGAAAVNGVIFIAQMVRYGTMKFMDYMMTKTWDWYKIVDHMTEKIRNESSTAVATPERIIF
jgi:hypothetical protein